MHSLSKILGAAVLAAMIATPAAALTPAVNADGSVNVPAFRLPYSSLASPESKKDLLAVPEKMEALSQPKEISERRRIYDEVVALPLITKLNARYAVDVDGETVAGIFVQTFTPKDGIDPKNKNRILVNLHGGGFMTGARTISQVESIPLAAVGRIKVISIDYRQAPEYLFPAASEDVAAVYKELLKTYKPRDIAFFGCSAGALLTAQALAWFQKEHLPRPAAAGIFCGAPDEFGVGDSAYVAPRIGAMLPPPENGKAPVMAYLAKANLKDPLVVPAVSSSVLRKFPPTLFVVGTRSAEFSAAAHAHIQLLKAGVDARLFAWEGMLHSFQLDPDLPESREAYDVMVKFFDEQMDKAGKKKR
jgi:acetyl esterase/lipase